MALDQYIKNNAQGRVTFKDYTPVTPVTLQCPFYGCDLAISGIRKILNEPTRIEAGGRLLGVVFGNRMYPEVSFSTFIAELTNVLPGVAADFIFGKGAYSANIGGWGALRPYCFDIAVALTDAQGGNAVAFTIHKFMATSDYATAIEGDKLAVSGWANSLSGDLVAGELP